MKQRKFKYIVFLILGLVSLVLAYFGIIMPGVPGIPFILMALFFFANSSEKLHGWMMRQKLIAKLVGISKSKEGAGWYKLFVISQLWVSIIVAECIFVSNAFWGIIIVIAGIGLSFGTYRLMSNEN